MAGEKPEVAVDDAEYERQLSLFSDCSTEKGIELLNIGEVIAGLRSRESFLDVGAGGGHLTVPVSALFTHTTIVEPNPIQVSFFRRRYPHIEVYEKDWSSADLGFLRFDFILCSHVLYYIPHLEWMAAIRKMYDHLSPGGRLAVVLQSPLGEVGALFNYFTGYDVPILDLWENINEAFGDTNVEIRYFTNEIFTESLDDMVSICLFLLLDPDLSRQRSDIAEYIHTHHRADGGYRINQDEILLVVKRE